MRIIMLQTRYGSEDGFVVRRFIKNQEYEIADSLAAYFIRHELAAGIIDKNIDSRLRGE
jgi:hypothetical protein